MLVFPIKLDRNIVVADKSNKKRINTEVLDASFLSGKYLFLDSKNTPITVSGYDSSTENGGKGLRVTNLCSIENGVVFKLCPACRDELPFESYSTRTTNERRDQSDCKVCRRKASTG
ncbi:hypothetical protein KIH87_18040 [Paraneptunicella aestuarii]|uniref:hypothetical protein n=1 Tax=Paraneptunicella aestuarii TaxID=2831148 RepID=UPI001E5F1471|nr:hypothetical protein [Paraneptunicella aestuarii]UAA38544.1 hypothetical protein KIH87_18040 [Paraneptunicella aestuarii]